jgi:membrane-associated protein
VTVLVSLAGESAGYLLGRRYGLRLRAGWLGRRLGEDRWVAAEAFLAGRGGRAVAAARFVAVVHALVPVVAGTLGMPYRRLVGWSALGAVARSVLYVGIGAAAGVSWPQHGDRVGLAALAVVADALAVALTVRTARSHAQRRHRGVPPSSRVQPLEPNAVDPLGGGRNERHDTAA